MMVALLCARLLQVWCVLTHARVWHSDKKMFDASLDGNEDDIVDPERQLESLLRSLEEESTSKSTTQAQVFQICVSMLPVETHALCVCVCVLSLESSSTCCLRR
jgi:hypothetical protein